MRTLRWASLSPDRICSAARSERTAARNVVGGASCAAAHRRIACPTALLAPVITAFICVLQNQFEARSSLDTTRKTLMYEVAGMICSGYFVVLFRITAALSSGSVTYTNVRSNN